jgi:hypothetical protein
VSDITWRDVYEGADELASHLDFIAERRARAGDYDASIHLMAASWALRELEQEVDDVREALGAGQ